MIFIFDFFFYHDPAIIRVDFEESWIWFYGHYKIVNINDILNILPLFYTPRVRIDFCFSNNNQLVWMQIRKGNIFFPNIVKKKLVNDFIMTERGGGEGNEINFI